MFKKIIPFIKYVGGKQRLVEILSKKVKDLNYIRYFEVFVGAGSLFLHLQPKIAFINDINEELILTYKLLKNADLYPLKQLLINHQLNHSKDYYHSIRKWDRDKNFWYQYSAYEIAARFIYLNKSAYNGLYRTNKQGQFNAAFNNKSKIKTFHDDNLENIKEYLTNAKITITNYDFEKVLKQATKNDLIYLDPPYDALHYQKETFVRYTADKFNKEDQIRLAKVFKELHNKGAYVMLTNHNTPLIQELYKDFNKEIIQVQRNIANDKNKRKSAEEIIITNF